MARTPASLTTNNNIQIIVDGEKQEEIQSIRPTTTRRANFCARLLIVQLKMCYTHWRTRIRFFSPQVVQTGPAGTRIPRKAWWWTISCVQVWVASSPENRRTITGRSRPRLLRVDGGTLDKVNDVRVFERRARRRRRRRLATTGTRIRKGRPPRHTC